MTYELRKSRHDQDDGDGHGLGRGKEAGEIVVLGVFLLYSNLNKKFF